ncbi:Uncharacterized protein A9P81_0023 [Leptospira interrogans serovar Copenhageni/Icterohaemorrhagiae]|nr:Uncharacterized protein A9P81_0023 [Leptospira interrogans serovar Copenhageni/Icterohaemorrhagiae]
MKEDIIFISAVRNLYKARAGFAELANLKIISGNDNHIGDVGEYYILWYLKSVGEDVIISGKRNSLYDLENNSTKEKISVKTITTWSKNGKRAQINTDSPDWNLLYCLYLGKDLIPDKVAKIDYFEFSEQKVIKENKERRILTNSKSFPQFQWWEWLENYRDQDAESKIKEHFRDLLNGKRK